MNGKGVIGAIFTVLTWVCVLCLLAGLFLSDQYYIAEKILAYVAYMGVVFALGLLFTGGISRFANLIFLGVTGFLMIMPLDTETSVTAMPKNREPYNVVYYNATSTNVNHGNDVIGVQSRNPDVLILAGGNDENYGAFSGMRNLFNSQFCTYKGEGDSSLAVMGSIAVKCKIGVYKGWPMAVIQAPDKKKMFIFNAPPAIDEETWYQRNDYLSKAGEFIKANGGMDEKVLVGSLNAPPYSKVLRNFVSDNKTLGTSSSYKATYYPERVKYDYLLTCMDENLSKGEIMDKLGSRHKPLYILWR